MDDSIAQSLLVYRQGDHFVAAGQIDRQIICRDPFAERAIQAAIDRLASGGEVLIERGDFPLHAPLRLTSNVTLRGRGRSSRLLVTGEGDAAIVASKADGVIVDKMSVIASDGRGNGSGIVFQTCGDCRIIDTFVAGFGAYGIHLRDSCFLCEIRGCQLAGNAKAAIFLQQLAHGRVGDFLPNSIANTSIYGGGEGIRAEHAIVVNIVGCSMFQNTTAAIHLLSDSNSVLISGCRTFQISGSAILAEKSHELGVTGNIFCWHTEDGIVVRGCRWGTISGNEIIDNGSFNCGAANETVRFDQLPSPPPPKCGIVLEDVRGYSVSGNAIFNWPQGTRMRAGVIEDEKCSRNLIASNTSNYFSQADVISRGSDSVRANNVSRGDEPHHGRSSYPSIQSFQPEVLRRFIGRQVGSAGREGGPSTGNAQ